MVRWRAWRWFFTFNAVQRQHLVKRFLPSDQPNADQVGSGVVQRFLIHGQILADGFVAVIAEPLGVTDCEQKKIQCGGAVTAVFNVPITHEALIDPTELPGDFANAFDNDGNLGYHHELLCCGLNGW